MEYLSEEKKYLEKKLETAEMKDEEVEDIMERFFKLADSVDNLEVEYSKYVSGKISY